MFKVDYPSYMVYDIKNKKWIDLRTRKKVK